MNFYLEFPNKMNNLLVDVAMDLVWSVRKQMHFQVQTSTKAGNLKLCQFTFAIIHDFFVI